jgi:hypothetical protein
MCVVSQFGSWKPVSTAQEMRLKGARQQGWEPLDMKTKDATPLKAATKQCSENSDGEH